MRRVFYSVGVVVLSIASTVVLAGVQTMTALVALTATALIMGGTGHPLSTPQDSQEFINGYTADANNDYIVLTGFCGAGSCTPTAVSTPEQFMPVSGAMPFDQSVGQGVTNLDQAINAQPAGEALVVFGYSQSARIASIQKGNLAAAGSTLPVSFVLIGNPNRPNGGILERFEGLNIPILGVTFDGATPTDTDFKTVDITRQYDGYSDFPNNPLNPLSTANAIAGIHYVHGDYQSVGLGDALYQGSYGDTDYYLIPSRHLPLLMPLDQAGVPSPVVTMLDAPTRVLVEAGYDRTISPGAPTQASILYFPNPVQTGMNFIVAIPTGMDDGAQEAANIRPFGTAPIDQRSPYGVGGPPVNAGSFDSTGAPLATPQPAASVPNAQTLAAPQQGPALPAQPAAGPGPLPPPVPAATTPSITAPAPAMDKAAPATPVAGMTPGWWKPAPLANPVTADSPKPAPVDVPTPAPLDLPKPAPLDLPKPAPVDLPKPADMPKADLPRTDILPKIVPPKIDPPAQAPILNMPKPDAIPAPAFVAPEIPAAPVAPPVQAPVLPELPALPAAPPPQLPALPPPPVMPALPPPPPLPNIAGILGGIRLPF
ncbi:PE-PPE domain-containing protein [Mycolicibacterium stellerae]|uniref:PE-PPE domain-containing protein n=1 Tax=Mycolicibacterium stellerae TaxID=2358193 RepID=UPI000F0B980F|nr:PE-PPE domain-containing protein [Mycolicibacterium stellerae]